MRIGYYAHSHGSGHLKNALQLKELLGELYIITDSTSPLVDESMTVIQKEDFPEGYSHPEASSSDCLHHYSVGDPRIRIRYAQFLAFVISNRIDFMIVDVSVEIAMFCKLCSIPYAYVRLFGDRCDLPHREAFSGAQFMLAYFPDYLEDPSTDEAVQRKSLYLGWVHSRPQETYALRDHSGGSIDRVYLVGGTGGNERVEQLAKHLLKEFGHTMIHVFGEFGKKTLHRNIVYHGFDNYWRTYIDQADLVVGSCGMTLVSEMMPFRNKFIAVPEARPFDEQQIFGHQLCHTGTMRVWTDGLLRPLLEESLAPQSKQSYATENMEKFNQQVSRWKTAP